jgi:hypothetical protein
MKNAIRSILFFCGVLFSLYGFAAAVIETATGTVSVGKSADVAAPISPGHRVQAGSMVITGPKSQAILRFDDGQIVVLHEHTEFRVAEYSFVKDAPAKDRFVFDLLRGAMRSITALVTTRTPKAYMVRAPQATIGIRGTDYMLAVVNPAYFGTLTGTIEVTNTAGTVTFAAGSTGFAANAAALPAPLAPGALPAAVSAAFKQLGSISLGALGATDAAAGGISPAAIAIGAAIAAGAAAAAGGGGGSAVTPSGTTTGTR